MMHLHGFWYWVQELVLGIAIYFAIIGAQVVYLAVKSMRRKRDHYE